MGDPAARSARDTPLVDLEPDPALRFIAESTPDNIMLLDLDLRIRYINWTVPELDPEGIRGTSVLDLISDDQHAPVRACFERVVRTGVADLYETRYVGADGVVSEWESRVGPVVRGDAVAGFAVISRNISEQRAREAQLRQQQKLEAIGRLAGGISHDFNNLLLSIRVSTSFARAATDDVERAADLARIEQAAERAAGLTRQLLAFSQRRPLRWESVDLTELARQHLSMLERLIPAHIQVRFLPAADLPAVRGDAGQLEQVLLNLAVNARDAMPAGGQLRIETTVIQLDEAFTREHPWARTGSWVRLRVADTGEGIAPAALEHLFEPFFTTKEPGKGTGLGLATAYGIVEQHGGFLHAESQAGRGAVFDVYLPIASETAAAPEVRLGEAPTAGAGTILLAEDHELVRDAITRLLEEAGYDVLAAEDGERAVELLRAHRDDVVLAVLDVVMPRLTGPEASRRMRALRPDLPVIFTTGHGVIGEAESNDEGAPTRILEKPYDPTDLLRAMRALLDSRDATR